MASARERLEGVVRSMRQRQEQEIMAAALWHKALPRCETLAKEIVEIVRGQGVHVAVVRANDMLRLAFKDREEPALKGAKCIFFFNCRSKCLQGNRLPFQQEGEEAKAEQFFSLAVTPPVVRRVENQFGPNGGSAPALGVDSQEAFERAVVDFLEWAMVKEGCGGEVVRLP